MSKILQPYSCDRCGEYCKDNDVHIDFTKYKDGSIVDEESFMYRLCHKCWNALDGWLEGE